MNDSPQTRRLSVHNDIVPTLDLRPFIGGMFVDPLSETVLPTSDPMTVFPLASIPLASPADVDAAVSAARQAFDLGTWSELHPRMRSRYLYRLAELIDRNRLQIALLESADTGKLYRGVIGWDIPNAALVCRYYAGLADKIAGVVLPGNPQMEMLVRREPIGVCAAIVAWNFPFAGIAWKIAPALAAGCTIVVKSPERAALSAQYLAALVKEAGFPRGAVNILCGTGEEAGRALVEDSRVDLITVTGSAETAQDILLTSRAHMPQLVFELGDKTPYVICKDADLQAAIPAACTAVFDLAGQNCCGASRILVQQSIFDQVVEEMATLAQRRRLGDQLDDGTEQGPQIDRAHVARIDQFVQEAVTSGGTIVVGGTPAGNHRQFYSPTLLIDLANNAPINRQEVFGPVGTIAPFTSLDEAIAIANDREYGLAAAIWTSNTRSSEHFAQHVRAGTCWINGYGIFDPVAPWGGRKLSGWGRELGTEGIEPFLVNKTIIRTY